MSLIAPWHKPTGGNARSLAFSPSLQNQPNQIVRGLPLSAFLHLRHPGAAVPSGVAALAFHHLWDKHRIGDRGGRSLPAGPGAGRLCRRLSPKRLMTSQNSRCILAFTHSHFVPWRARSSFTSSSRPQAIHPHAARHRPGVAPQRPGLRRAAGADRHRLAATNNAPLPAPGMEWGPGNRPPEADPNPTCAMGRTSRPPAAAYVQDRGTKPTAHPCVVAHRHR